jgi:dienelactone hydrolase
MHDGSGTPRPALISCNVLDSMQEQVLMAGHRAANLECGINTLFVDQPASGDALRKRKLTAVYDSERRATPALDHLLTRKDVTAHEVGTSGLSLGGYHAPRAAASKPRFALCAVMGANHCWSELQKRRSAREGEKPLPHYWDQLMWAWGQPSLEALMACIPQVSLEGQIKKLRMPLLITHGAGDRQIPVSEAQHNYDQAVHSSKREPRLRALRGGQRHRDARFRRRLVRR